METQIKPIRSHDRPRLGGLGELSLVFVPVLVLLIASASWVGDDPMRGFMIAWAANIFMLVAIGAGMRIRKKSWKDIGLTLPKLRRKEALSTIAWSIPVLIAGVLAWIIAPVLLSNILEVPATADFSGYEFLQDNPVALLLTLLGVYFISSFAEEVIYRGFLISRLAELTSGTRYNKVIAVLISSVFFGLIHYQWGAMGMFQTGFFGLAMGTSYVLLRKRLWILILSHAYMDTLLLVNLYLAGS